VSAGVAELINRILPPTPTTSAQPNSTLTATPVPAAAVLLTNARRAAFNGDDDKAIELYTLVISRLLASTAKTTSTEIDLYYLAMLELGQIQFSSGNSVAALKTFSTLNDTMGDANRQFNAAVHIGTGRALRLRGRPLEAIEQFNKALARLPELSSHIHTWIGASYLEAKLLPNAIASFQQVVRNSEGTQQFDAREKLALAYQLNGDYALAVDEYKTILANAKIPSYRARMMWEVSQVYEVMGRTSDAIRTWKDITNLHSATPQAHFALLKLLENNQTILETQRGIINYHNNKYDLAAAAFKRALQQKEAYDEILYWAGLNHLAMGNTTNAIVNWDQLLKTQPDSPRYADAAISKANVQANLGNYSEAIESFRALSRELGNRQTRDPKSAFAMQQIAVMLDRSQLALEGEGRGGATRWDEAAKAHLAAFESYPYAEGASKALLRAAIDYYRNANYDDAVKVLLALLSQFSSGADAPMAQLWLGKTYLAMKKPEQAKEVLQSLTQSNSYEASRAGELLGAKPRPMTETGGMNVSPSSSDLYNDATLRDEAQNWLKTWVKPSPSLTETRELPSSLAINPVFVRGNLLWAMGLRNEANEEFSTLNSAKASDPLALYHLALHYQQIGSHRLSISTANALFRQSPTRNIRLAPKLIGRLIYPVNFSDLVFRHAEDYDIDPRVIFAVIRQESMFDPVAISGASARGLMQVMPATGKEISQKLSWPPDYTERDLARPYVSVRFGSYYLGTQFKAFEGDWYAALAAYNAGPSRSKRWKALSVNDPDLFVQAITLDEPVAYIRAISANYAMYRWLYE
jgi:soluble lytic murein transglycosylase